jgi:hypothetical protein
MTEPIDMAEEARSALLSSHKKGSVNRHGVEYAQACALISLVENLAYLADTLDERLRDIDNRLGGMR